MRGPLFSLVGSLAVTFVFLQCSAPAQSRKPAAPRSDPFPTGSVWVDDASTLKLTVLERKGDTFGGTLLSGDAVERTFTGTVRNSTVTWRATDVRATKGGAGGDNTGTINGDRIDFKWDSGTAKGEFTLRRQGKRASKQRPQRGGVGN